MFECETDVEMFKCETDIVGPGEIKATCQLTLRRVILVLSQEAQVRAGGQRARVESVRLLALETEEEARAEECWWWWPHRFRPIISRQQGGPAISQASQ